MPPFSALLASSVPQMFGNEAPVFRAVFLHQFYEDFVFFLAPGSFADGLRHVHLGFIGLLGGPSRQVLVGAFIFAGSFSGSVPVADRLFRWALLGLDVG